MASMENVRDRSPDRRDRRDGSSARRSGGGGQGAYRGGGGGGGKSASNSRRAPPERRIFVSNIPFEMKWQEVKDLFRDNVGDVSYVELFNDENEKPRGCGILEFASEDLAKNAVDKMHRYEYKGRKLVVKEDFETERDKYGRIISSKGVRSGGGGSDRDNGRDNRGSDRRDMSGSMRGGQPEGYGNTYGLSPQFLESLGIDSSLHTRLFVANLSYTVDERKLREVFRLAGRVVMVELNRDKDGKSRGHAVIEFDHPVEAVQAISMFNDQALYDRKLTVRFDKSPGPTPEELAQLPSRLPEGLGGVGMGLGSGGNPLTEVAKNLPQSNQNQSIQSGSTSGTTSGSSGGMNVLELAKTIAVARQLDMMGSGMGQQGQGQLGNLGNLAGALSNMGSSQGHQGMSMSGGPMGSNMSGMSGNMQPVKQQSMGGSAMTGGSMSGGPMDNYMSPMGRGPMDDMGGPRGPMSDMGPSRGGPPSGPSGYSTSAPSSGPSGGPSSGYGSSMNRGGPMEQRSMGGSRPFDTIVIRNLPLDCNWQVLRDGFSHCGDIKYAEMKERGTGLIRFAYEKDAERAITMMHNQKVNDRVIDVRPYY